MSVQMAATIKLIEGSVPAPRIVANRHTYIPVHDFQSWATLKQPVAQLLPLRYRPPVKVHGLPFRLTVQFQRRTGNSCHYFFSLFSEFVSQH